MRLNGSSRDVSARPQGNFELYAWFFMRVTGVVLLGIAVFHLLYMHMVLKVDNITYDTIAERWQNPGWRLFDLSLLVFALLHGTNGVRTIIDDYVPKGLGNVGSKWAMYIVTLVFILMGAHVIMTFKAPAMGVLPQ
jgi:succinate dehydrogenase / fumarate reductase membrane anchor subunit